MSVSFAFTATSQQEVQSADIINEKGVPKRRPVHERAWGPLQLFEGKFSYLVTLDTYTELAFD